MKMLPVAIMLLLLAANPASAQLEGIFKELRNLPGGLSGGLSDAKIRAGLQEALKVGTGNAVLQTGAEGGFLLNQAIKITMPETLRNIERPLRLVGYGPQIDAFVIGMNRAAERATPFARNIIWNAISDMTFDDVRKIFNGGDTAATDYFRSKTTKSLQAAFLPSVTDVMNDVGVNRQYNELIGKYQNLPFSSSIAFDVNKYVTEKTTDGLFHVIAEEEKKIRTNPSARVTDLLKEVFGSRK